MSREIGLLCQQMVGSVSTQFEHFAGALSRPMYTVSGELSKFVPRAVGLDEQLAAAIGQRSHATGTPGEGSGKPSSRIAERTWVWGPEDVYRRWEGAIAVRPKNGVVEGHLMVVSDGPNGASVQQRAVYAAELAREMESCNVILSRRGLDADFGPIHVLPREFGDGKVLLWTKQHEGQPLKPLIEFPCGFCKVIAGDMDAEILATWPRGAESPDAVGLVPLEPVRDGGHELVIPTRHVQDVSVDPELSGSTIGYMVEQTRDKENVDIVTSVGSPATQTARHLHVHGVTRDENDGLEIMTQM